MSAPGRTQATVETYQATSRSGTVLLDDGVRLSFAAEALSGTGLRLLRPGQRVRVQVDAAESSTVLRVQILTLP